MRRLFAGAATAALAVAGVILSPITPATADPAGSCSTSTGVLVVVDLRPFGGSVTRGCDTTPTDGYEALQEAGFTTEGTTKDGPAFICRINGRPTARQDPCVRTPPASAYWSYWHANAGQKTWSYSQLGAMSYKPKSGSVDAWVFGGTDVGGTTGQPCFSPADARAGRATACPTKAQPQPTRTTKKSPTSDRPDRGSTGDRSVAGAGPASSGTSTPTTTTTGTRAPSSAVPSSSAAVRPAAGTSPASSASSAPAIGDASQAAADRNDASSGSATPVVLGVGLALVLAAGAGVTMLRRRRTDPEL